MAIVAFPTQTNSLAVAIRMGCRMTQPGNKLWIGRPGAWLRFKPRGVDNYPVMPGRQSGYEASLFGAAYVGTYCAGRPRAIAAASALLRRGLLDVKAVLEQRYPILHRRVLAHGRAHRFGDLLFRLDEYSFMRRERLADYVERIEHLALKHPIGRIPSPIDFEPELARVLALRAGLPHSSARTSL